MSDDEALQPMKLPRLDVAFGERLGAGAFGTVWAARDVLLDRMLAVKFLTGTDESLNEDALIREARSLARISHPNLVTVYGAAWLRHPDTGLIAPAIMMELLRGVSLAEWWPVAHDRESSLRVARDMALGIQAMHAAGLPHGDLHPGNVMVLGDGRAKIIDWRYQDTMLQRSTAHRRDLVDADLRRVIDLIVSLLERQGVPCTDLSATRLSSLSEVLSVIAGLSTARPVPDVEADAPRPSDEPTFEAERAMWTDALAEHQNTWKRTWPEYGVFSAVLVPAGKQVGGLDYESMRARVRRARARGAGLEVPTSDDRASGKVRNRKSAIQGRLDLGDFQEVWQLHQSGAFMYAALLHYSENEGRRVLPFELPIWWVGLSLRFASQFYGELMQEGRIRYEFRLDGVKGQRLGRLRDDGRRMYDDYTCLETTIEAVGMTSIAGLSTAWRSTVAAAIRPMYSLFGWEITAATIDGQLDELGR